MTPRTLLLCHKSLREGEELADMLRAAMDDTSIVVAADLTEVYDTVEHSQPTFLVTAKELALHPDYAGIQALVQQIGVDSLTWDSATRRFVWVHDLARNQHGHSLSIDQFIDFVDRKKSPPSAARPNIPARSRGPQAEEGAIILIGASTGGVDAICKVIQYFGPTSPPTLIVQHTSGQFAQSLGRLLNGMTDADVVLSQHDQKLAMGTIYLAPGNGHHLLLSPTKSPQIALGTDGLICGHRPSVDALFRSAVPKARQVAAALLTGMGRDGAEGLKALRAAGAHTIVQDQATSVVYGMPRIAAEIGAATQQLPLEKIGPTLLNACQTRTTA